MYTDIHLLMCEQQAIMLNLHMWNVVIHVYYISTSSVEIENIYTNANTATIYLTIRVWSMCTVDTVLTSRYVCTVRLRNALKTQNWRLIYAGVFGIKLAIDFIHGKIYVLLVGVCVSVIKV